jgi:hypothetical protein
MKKAVFYFEFSNPFEVAEDAEPDIVYYGFNMRIDESAIVDGYYDLDMDFEEQVEEMEYEYGTHDWSSSPHDDVEGFGYSAYEADFARIPELMEKWRAYFEQRSEFSDTTDVVRLHIDVNDAMGMSDKDFYDQIARQLK